MRRSRTKKIEQKFKAGSYIVLRLPTRGRVRRIRKQGGELTRQIEAAKNKFPNRCFDHKGEARKDVLEVELRANNDLMEVANQMMELQEQNEALTAEMILFHLVGWDFKDEKGEEMPIPTSIEELEEMFYDDELAELEPHVLTLYQSYETKKK